MGSMGKISKNVKTDFFDDFFRRIKKCYQFHRGACTDLPPDRDLLNFGPTRCLRTGITDTVQTRFKQRENLKNAIESQISRELSRDKKCSGD